jgi:ATP-binding cassette subfamily F protein 3
MARIVDHDEIEKRIRTVVPLIDEGTMEYIQSWFEDNDNLEEGSVENMVDFLGPLLLDAGGEEDDIDELCINMAPLVFTEEQLGPQTWNGLQMLDGPVSMMDRELISATLDLAKPQVTDLTFTSTKNSRAPISSVDVMKLRQQEEKQKKKQDLKNNKVPTPMYESNKAPPIIVTQPKVPVINPGSQGMAKDVTLENFDISYGGHQIIRDANLQLSWGRRYGLVGRNGIGKTTLLRAISSGELKFPSSMTILHVEQEVHGDETTAMQSVLSADKVRTDLLEREKELNAEIGALGADAQSKELSDELKRVYQKLEEIEADKAESRAGAILSGLGFTNEQQVWPTKQFSGGWRMRLALARALFCKPDLLLLDEVGISKR